MHQLWQAIILKPFKLAECILHFWKSPIFINLAPVGQGHSCILTTQKFNVNVVMSSSWIFTSWKFSESSWAELVVLSSDSSLWMTLCLYHTIANGCILKSMSVLIYENLKVSYPQDYVLQVFVSLHSFGFEPTTSQWCPISSLLQIFVLLSLQRFLLHTILKHTLRPTLSCLRNKIQIRQLHTLCKVQIINR